VPDDNKRRATQLVLAAAAPFVVLVLVVGFFLVGILGAVVLAVVVGVGLVVGVRRSALGAVRRAVGGRPADAADHARLTNLTDSLAIAAGVPVPELVVVDDPAPNALAAGLEARDAVVVVTTGLLSTLDRVQLEAVLAHVVARIRALDIRPGTVAVPVLRWFGGVPGVRGWVVGAALGPGRLAEADLEGVALTRYPPALAAALERIAAAGGTVRSRPSIAHLWLDPPLPSADPLVRPPLEERIAALREL